MMNLLGTIEAIDTAVEEATEGLAVTLRQSFKCESKDAVDWLQEMNMYRVTCIMKYGIDILED